MAIFLVVKIFLTILSPAEMIQQLKLLCMMLPKMNAGRSQNLKEVPQNFTKVFKIDEVTANNVIQRNQHRK